MTTLQEIIKISLAEQFANTPGARNIDEGEFSGEAFLHSCILSHFKEALSNDSVLLIDLDNTEGYATSFLEEAFGGLARMFDAETVLNHIEFKSDDEPLLIEEIKTYIKEANK